MPVQPTYPGVYVQELPEPHAITGCATAITAFVGALPQGPVGTPTPCLSFGEFQKAYGGLDPAYPTSFQVSQFFLNGGGEAWVSRLAVAAPDGTVSGFDIAGSEADGSGIHALDGVAQFDLLCVPDIAALDTSSYLAAATATLNYALARQAFVLLDLPETLATPAGAAAWASETVTSFGPGIINAAGYFPQVLVPSPGAAIPLAIGPSGTMAGLYAVNDANRGVWSAPAGISQPLAGVQQLACVMTDAENGVLAAAGLNALRTFPMYGNVPWGARTLAAETGTDHDWNYVPVRRLALYIECSLTEGLQWVVFEPDDAMLWSQIVVAASAFLQPLYQQGAFAGSSKAEAYHVICDASTTSPADAQAGIVNLTVLFAPLVPAEFVVLNFQFAAGQPS